MNISDETREKFNLKVNPSNFIYSILGGQAKFTPEMIQDIEAYWGITAEDLFTFTKKAIDKSGTTLEVNIKIENVPTYRADKETIWKFSVVTAETKQELLYEFFSGSTLWPKSVDKE